MEAIKNRRNVLTAVIKDNGVVMDLTGFQAKIVVCLKLGSTPVLTKSGTIPTPANGTVNFILLPADLAGIVATDYVCEVNIWKTTDITEVYTPIQESFELKAGYTDTPTA